MKATQWTPDSIQDMHGKIIIITGANSGLGFEASRILAEKNATVVMACRDLSRGHDAAKRIKQLHPPANLTVIQLNLASSASIRSCAENIKNMFDHCDVLLNNAGVMAPPYSLTEDGFELQIGVNHFGHFLLTGLLMDMLIKAPAARIVTMSSFAHYMGAIRFDDSNWTKGYLKWPAYGQSKLANLLFTYELDRRLKQANRRTIAVAAHPGYANTNLQRYSGLFSFLNRYVAQPAAMGVLPALYAATAWDVGGGQYFGPNGFLQLRGYPKRTRSSRKSYDEDVARRLWELSEKQTGVTYRLR